MCVKTPSHMVSILPNSLRWKQMMTAALRFTVFFQVWNFLKLDDHSLSNHDFLADFDFFPEINTFPAHRTFSAGGQWISFHPLPLKTVVWDCDFWCFCFRILFQCGGLRCISGHESTTYAGPVMATSNAPSRCTSLGQKKKTFKILFNINYNIILF